MSVRLLYDSYNHFVLRGKLAGFAFLGGGGGEGSG